MTYKVQFASLARRHLRKVKDKATRDNILQKIVGLASDPRPNNVEKLTDVDGHRIRAGDFRIVFDIDDKDRTVSILRIVARGAVYGKKYR